MQVKYTPSNLATGIFGVVAVVLGILMLANPGDAAMFITSLVGWALIVTAAVLIINAFRYKESLFSQVPFYIGLICLIFGIVIVAQPQVFVIGISIIIGIYVLIMGFAQLFASNAIKNIGIQGSNAAMIGAILTIILGVLMLIVPLAAAGATMVLGGISLIYAGVVCIVDAYRRYKYNVTL